MKKDKAAILAYLPSSNLLAHHTQPTSPLYRFLRTVLRLGFYLGISILGIMLNPSALSAKDYMTHKEFSTFLEKVEKLNHIPISSDDVLVAITIQNGKRQCLRIGWMISMNDEIFSFREISGIEMTLPRDKMISFGKIEPDRNLTDLMYNYANYTEVNSIYAPYKYQSTVEKSLLALWLHKINFDNLGIEVLSSMTDEAKNNEHLKEGFGALYYLQMLHAYCLDRNLTRTKEIAEYLKVSYFDSFYYQKIALQLSSQLDRRPRDFQSLVLPSTAEWINFKTELNTEERLQYLTERIHLLNCFSHPTEKKIWLDGPQTSVPFHALTFTDVDSTYYKSVYEFQVINPYWEVLRMNIQFVDAKVLMPLLLDSSFIPTMYSSGNNKSHLHLVRYNDVISLILYELTGRNFIEIKNFKHCKPEEQKTLVEEGLQWIEDNKSKSPIERLHNILEVSMDWGDFNSARMAATQALDSNAAPIILRAYNRFMAPKDSLHRGLIAKTLYDIGSEREMKEVISWFNQSTEKSVLFWSAMYLLKHDSLTARALTCIEKVTSEGNLRFLLLESLINELHHVVI